MYITFAQIDFSSKNYLHLTRLLSLVPKTRNVIWNCRLSYLHRSVRTNDDTSARCKQSNQVMVVIFKRCPLLTNTGLWSNNLGGNMFFCFVSLRLLFSPRKTLSFERNITITKNYFMLNKMTRKGEREKERQRICVRACVRTSVQTCEKKSN